MIDSLIDRDGKRVLLQLSALYDRGVDLKKLCEELTRHLRDLIYVKATNEPPKDRSDVEKRELQDQAGKVELPQLSRLFDLLHGTLRELGHAAEPRMTLEVALLTGVHLAPSQGLAELTARLEALASKTGGAIQATEVRPTAKISPPQKEPSADILSQVESMVRGKGGREISTRRKSQEEPSSNDEDAPARLLPAEAPPGGCATGECLPEAPALQWRKAIDGIRKKAPLLAVHLSEGALLWLRQGGVGLGYSPSQRFHRQQLQGALRKDAEKWLSEWFHAPTQLHLEEPKEDVLSLAEEARRAAKGRAHELSEKAKAAPEVIAVQTLLGGEIEEIEVLERDA
jgi:DNA polymerase-3 subunit gamma/tau